MALPTPAQIAAGIRASRPERQGRGLHAPSALLTALEIPRVWAESGTLVGTWPALQLAPRAPKPDPQAVLVLPGFRAGDRSTAVLRAYLRTLGYPTHGWGLGTNLGPSRARVEGMTRLLNQTAEASGFPVSVVGWSLGGIFGRDLARRHPDLVRSVITLGSPLRLRPTDGTRASRSYDRLRNTHSVPADLPFVGTHIAPLPMPATAIWSRTDGIVPWRACREAEGPLSEDIEVLGSHCGLGVNPPVLFAVADRLAEPPETWRPFQAPLPLRPLYR